MSESFQSAWTTSAKSRQNLPRNVGVAKKHSCDVMTPRGHNSHGKHTKTTVGSDFKAYQIIVADAADAASVNFSGRCKFLQI